MTLSITQFLPVSGLNDHFEFWALPNDSIMTGKVFSYDGKLFKITSEKPRTVLTTFNDQQRPETRFTAQLIK